MTVPRSLCLDEAKFGAGTHVIAVEADCGIASPSITADSVSPNFSNPPVGLGSLELDNFAWSMGDTVSAILHAQDEDLDISVDFSAVDSEYTLGDEVVTDLGGGDYEIEYTLSSLNTRDPGEYRLPVEISDGVVVREHPGALLVWYTPAPTGVIEFQDTVSGDFVFGDLPTGALSTVSLDTESVVITTWPGAMAFVTAEVTTATNLDGTALIVNVREDGTGGYATSEVWINESTCSAGSPSTCVATIQIPLRISPSRIDDVSDDDNLDIELSLGVYTPSGAAFTGSILLPDPWIVSKQPANTIAMTGRQTYLRLRQVGIANPQNPIHPQYGIAEVSPETNPLRRVTIEVSDGCSHTYTTETNKSGSWQMYVPKECASNTYTVKVKPITSFGIYHVRTRDHDDVLPAIEIGTQSIGGTAFNWPTQHWDLLELEYGNFSTFMIGVQLQEWAKPYLVGDGKVKGFPWMNFSFERGEVVDPGLECDITSCYASGGGTIFVGAGDSNRDEEDEWALTHEAFHWYQDMFMAALDGNGSSNTWAGAFGEGFASMMHGPLRGDQYKITSTSFLSQAELTEYEGNFVEAADIADNWFPGLPFDLYNTTGDNGSGGWSWRILWDFFDDSDIEPDEVFARMDDDGSGTISVSDPDTQNFQVGFDEIGSPEKFQDVIVRYLGGNLMPDNTSRPDLDDRGEDGLDMTEFLDGMQCRGHEEWDDMEVIVLDMMDFQEYDPFGAPVSCP